MSRRAFSLIEVMFTVSLLAVVFMILLSIFPTAMFSVRQTEHRLVAAGIAQAILDECRSGPFLPLATNQVIDSTSPGALGELLRRSNHLGDDGMEYVPRLTVGTSPTSSAPRSTLCQLTVLVSWHERGQTLAVTRILQLASINR